MSLLLKLQNKAVKKERYRLAAFWVHASVFCLLFFFFWLQKKPRDQKTYLLPDFLSFPTLKIIQKYFLLKKENESRTTKVSENGI